MAAKVQFLTSSVNEHSASSLALVFHTNNNIELKSFTNVAIDGRTESKAMESKSKTEIEENSLLTICQLFLLVIWLRYKSKIKLTLKYHMYYGHPISKMKQSLLFA